MPSTSAGKFRRTPLSIKLAVMIVAAAIAGGLIGLATHNGPVADPTSSQHSDAAAALAFRTDACALVGGRDVDPKDNDFTGTGIYGRKFVVKGNQAIAAEFTDVNAYMIALPSQYALDPGGEDVIYDLRGQCGKHIRWSVLDPSEGFHFFSVGLRGADVYYPGGYLKHIGN